MARSKFKYQEPDQKKLKERSEQTGGRFDSPFRDNTDLFLPKEGDHTIRILPPTWDNHEHYGYDIWLHSYVGADNSNYLCPRKMKDKPCPICEAANEAKLAGEEEDAKKMAVTRRIVVWVIDRKDESEPPIPKLWSMSWTQDRDIVEVSKNKKTGKVLLIDHPDDGYDVFFKRTGKGLNTKYFGWQIDREASPIVDDDKEQEGILDFIQENPIPGLLKFYSTDYLEKMISGGVEKKDEELDDEDDTDTDTESKNEGREARQSSKKEDERPQRRRARPSNDEEISDEGNSVPSRRQRFDDDNEPAQRHSDDDDPPFDDAEDLDTDGPPPRRRANARNDDNEDKPPPRRRANR